VDTEFKVKLPFALQDDRLVHVSEVEAGLACGCVCPACKETLVAKKGPKLTHHFSHLCGLDCAHAFETALHLAAKRVLETHKRMRIPDVSVGFNSYKKPWVISVERDIHFEQVSVETKLGNVVPDLLVHVEGRPLAIEIAVTHFVDGLKLKKLSDLGLSTLEIDLAEFSRTPTLEVLEDEIVFSVRSKRWLFNAKVEAINRKLPLFVERKRLIQRGLALHVDYCPINKRTWKGKSYANVVDDCVYCEYCFDPGPGMGDGFLSCLGPTQIESYQDFLAATHNQKSPPGLDRA
jgi:hypothetical protein